MANKKIVFWICGVLTIFAITIFVLMFMSMENNRKALEEANKTILKEQTINSTCSVTRDSLSMINTELSKYKALSQAMIHRDEATSQLKHKVGDMVYLKNDSSRVVIEDVLIGGGKYNYYVKYRVLLKDNTTREMVPELIY
jgi:uncharacterized protein YpmS